MVAGISNGGNLMDGEDPLILRSGTTTTLGKPGGMDPCILVNLTGGKNKSTLKSVLRIKNASAYIETMGVTEGLNEISNGVEVTNGQSVSGP
jgi:hypothetical protein